ncbi:hypothetical protein PNOK_0524500 [Pyrrhoderma noxium]|uniref:Uncharacterized protein n=1 Tax=Pyrrhoderma noxium TaxID=2282107 RepID=A0A286UFN3_9AGAM|nr:hypothetical protein PNOK_0524500 [Pyrrhoderma noxium]
MVPPPPPPHPLSLPVTIPLAAVATHLLSITLEIKNLITPQSRTNSFGSAPTRPTSSNPVALSTFITPLGFRLSIPCIFLPQLLGSHSPFLPPRSSLGVKRGYRQFYFMEKELEITTFWSSDNINYLCILPASCGSTRRITIRDTYCSCIASLLYVFSSPTIRESSNFAAVDLLKHPSHSKIETKIFDEDPSFILGFTYHYELSSTD